MNCWSKKYQEGMMAEYLSDLIIILITFYYILESSLEHLNYVYWSSVMPAELKDFYTPERYAKAFFYNQEKYFLSAYDRTYSFIVLFLMIIAGGFNFIDTAVRHLTDNNILISITFFMIIYVSNHILMMPFQIYNIFVIENRYGFNRTGIPLFIKDNLISVFFISILISCVVALIIFLYEIMGKTAWLFTWMFITAFILFIQYYYTTIIVPLFNKLKLLEKGSLYEKIERYAENIHFPVDKIFVMDASRRSSKANAFFSGFGKRKSIVIHDTLLANHTEDEIISVIAHESGHYKKKHTLQMFLISSISSGIMLYLLFQSVETSSMSYAMGIQKPGFHGSILAFGILFGPVSFLMGIITNIISRKNEYDADQYAKHTASGKNLINALKKFSVEHLSNLKPHPLYVFFNYSHPPVLERISRLKN